MVKSDIHTWIYPWIYPWISISTATHGDVADVRFRVSQLSCLENERTNERMTENVHITSALLAVVIVIINVKKLCCFITMCKAHKQSVIL